MKQYLTKAKKQQIRTEKNPWHLSSDLSSYVPRSSKSKEGKMLGIYNSIKFELFLLVRNL